MKNTIKPILISILVLLLTNVALASQADNVLIYQSTPDPSARVSKPEIAYVTIFNNGAESVNLTEIINNWSVKQIQDISNAFIGNDKIGYFDVKANTTVINNTIVNLSLKNGIVIEPKNFVSFYYSFQIKDSSADKNNTITINAIFSDNSSKIREVPISIKDDAMTIIRFNVDENEGFAAIGANDTILPYQQRLFIFNITELTNSKPYTGTVSFTFPEQFTDINGTNIGNVSSNCTGNLCTCSFNGLKGESQTCAVLATIPEIPDSHFVIIADLTGKNNTGHPYVNHTSELVVRLSIPPPAAPLKIHNCTIEPRVFEVPGTTVISAFVTPPGLISQVYANITGPSQKILQLNQQKSSPNFANNFSPVLDGNYSVVIYAKDKRNNTANLSCGTINAIAPVFPPPVGKCEGVYSVGLASQPLIIEPAKAKALTNLNYYCVRNLLGLWTYDFYFEMKYLNGTVVNVDGVDIKYGKYPPSGAVVFALNRLALLNTGTGYVPVVLAISVWMM